MKMLSKDREREDKHWRRKTHDAMKGMERLGEDKCDRGMT